MSLHLVFQSITFLATKGKKSRIIFPFSLRPTRLSLFGRHFRCFLHLVVALWTHGHITSPIIVHPSIDHAKQPVSKLTFDVTKYIMTDISVTNLISLLKRAFAGYVLDWREKWRLYLFYKTVLKLLQYTKGFSLNNFHKRSTK